MRCLICGNEVEEGKFCTVCGTYAVVPSTPKPDQQYDNRETTFSPKMEDSYNSANFSQPYANQPPHNINPIPHAIPTPTNFTLPSNGKSVASLVLGIVAISLGSICSCLFSFLGGIPSMVCAIVGLVLGVQSNNAAKRIGLSNSKAQAGIVLSIVSLIIISIFIIMYVILGITFASPTITI